MPISQQCYASHPSCEPQHASVLWNTHLVGRSMLMLRAAACLLEISVTSHLRLDRPVFIGNQLKARQLIAHRDHGTDAERHGARDPSRARGATRGSGTGVAGCCC
eukprot:363910-Chlamydomonas_euryale.AAC.7